MIGDLYEAGLVEGNWLPALEKLRVILGSAETSFVSTDPTVTIGTTNHVLSPESREAYVRYYGRLDPKRPFFANKGVGFLFNDAAHFDNRFVAHDPFYQEFSIPLGTRHTLDLFAGRSGAQDIYLAAMRSRAQGPYDPAEADTLRRAGTHFLRAWQLREKIRESQAAAERSSAALESLTYGIIITNCQSRILLANSFARRVLANCHELTIRRGSFSTRTGNAGQALDEMMRKAVAGGAPGSPLRLTGPDRRGFLLWCVRLPESSPLSLVREPGLLFVLTDPDRQGRISPRDLQTLYGLTRAEAQLAQALGEGQRLDEIASLRRVKVSTVRTQLLHILAKMGLHRQADLARVLASLAKPVAECPNIPATGRKPE
jgi:DNA-binding CsgD family transcriptional regulator